MNQRGIIALLIGIVAMFLASTLALSSVFVFLNRAKAAKNIVFSYEGMYAAESGVEDALLRLLDPGKADPATNPYVLLVGQAIASTTIGSEVGGRRTIISEGSRVGRIRKTMAVLRPSTQKVQLFFGAQVGDGGLVMGNNSTVDGNVFSNGNVVPAKGGDKGNISNAITVAGTSRIEGVIVGGDAGAYSCKDSTITGKLTYTTGGSVTKCTASGGTSSQSTATPSLVMPISQSAIDGWREDAEAGGTITGGDFNPPQKSTSRIGPGVIFGNMLLNNNQNVILTGIVYVRGNVDIDNGSSITLDSSYGSNSGVLLMDGWTHIQNNTGLTGSGQAGSYLLMLSTSKCNGTSGDGCTHHNAAIDLHNNASGAIIYANDGLINLHNNVDVKEISGYKIQLDNNAVIRYEIGLEDLTFSSGPSGGSDVSSWSETE